MRTAFVPEAETRSRARSVAAPSHSVQHPHRAETGAPAGMPVYLHGHFGAGEPAPSSARAAAEHVTRTPLERVRVHTGDGVDAAAAAIGARAYTVGRDVHVAREAYEPGTAHGDRLLVHEMVHAAQQGGVAVAPGTRVPMSDPGEASERQAEAAASRVGDGAARAA